MFGYGVIMIEQWRVFVKVVKANMIVQNVTETTNVAANLCESHPNTGCVEMLYQ